MVSLQLQYNLSTSTAYQKTCPHGLAWASVQSKCEWPDKVSCGNRPVTERFTGGPNKPASGPPCSCIGGIKECYSAGKVKLKYMVTKFPDNL